MRNLILAAAAALATTPAAAFCGFYVGKADADLFNEASKVVMVRDDDRTVVTMVNDYQGELTDFAMVIPTPVVLQEDQISVTRAATVDHLDAYTAPRLVEYFDPNPCDMRRQYRADSLAMSAPPPMAAMESAGAAPEDFGVTIEAEYTVGEYDILILSAEQSDGLQRWLDMEGYRTPPETQPVLESYIRQNMKFFVAKINLEEQAQTGLTTLRPLRIAYEHNRFMLPIRLGTVNARGTQDILIYMLTRTGRVETANYRTIRIPTGMDLPVFLKDGDAFGDFYQAMFQRQVDDANGRAVFLEYAWDMNWCDPCAADPLSSRELKELGVFWADESTGRRRFGGQAQNVFVTRLHARYDAQTFPEDLMFIETGDRSNFQGRYVLRHPATGDLSCRAGREYQQTLPARFEREAQRMANLTGWDIAEIRDRMAANGQAAPEVVREPWWRRILD